MDILTTETRWALNNEIIKQLTSSWSLCLFNHVLFNLFSWGTLLNFFGFFYILVRIYSFLVAYVQMSVTFIFFVVLREATLVAM